MDDSIDKNLPVEGASDFNININNEDIVMEDINSLRDHQPTPAFNNINNCINNNNLLNLNSNNNLVANNFESSNNLINSQNNNNLNINSNSKNNTSGKRRIQPTYI